MPLVEDAAFEPAAWLSRRAPPSVIIARSTPASRRAERLDTAAADDRPGARYRLRGNREYSMPRISRRA